MRRTLISGKDHGGPLFLRSLQILVDVALVLRFIRDVRKHGDCAKASRASGYYTLGHPDAFFDEYS